MIACAASSSLSDLVHRGDGSGRWRAWSAPGPSSLTGLVCTVSAGASTSPRSSLRPFIDYYLVFGPGHAESGALPIPDARLHGPSSSASVVVVVAAVTCGSRGSRLVRGAPLVLARTGWPSRCRARDRAVRREGARPLRRRPPAAGGDHRAAAAGRLGRTGRSRRSTTGGSPWPGLGSRQRRSRIAPAARLGWFRQPVRSGGSGARRCRASRRCSQTAADAPSAQRALVGGADHFPSSAGRPPSRDRRLVRRPADRGRHLHRPRPGLRLHQQPRLLLLPARRGPAHVVLPRQHGVPEFTQDDRRSTSSRRAGPSWWSSTARSGCRAGTARTTRCGTTRSRSTCWTAGPRSCGATACCSCCATTCSTVCPHPPELRTARSSTGLWFAAPACDFGDTAELPHLRARPGRRPPSTSAPPSRTGDHLRGWAYDLGANGVRCATSWSWPGAWSSPPWPRPPAPGRRRVRSTAPRRRGERLLRRHVTPSRTASCRVYAVYSDGVAHPLAGRRPPRVASPGPGRPRSRSRRSRPPASVDDLTEEERGRQQGRRCPRGPTSRTYRAGRALEQPGRPRRRAELQLSDAPERPGQPRPAHPVRLAAPGRAARSGCGSAACLQWHGYAGQRRCTSPSATSTIRSTDQSLRRGQPYESDAVLGPTWSHSGPRRPS